MNVKVPVRIQTGAPVRIDGKEYYAGPVISGGRVFYDKEAGTQIVLSEIAQMRMALAFRLLDNSPFEKLSNARRHALRIDWGTFTPLERKIALSRALFVRKLDKIEPALQRSKKKVLIAVIEEVSSTWKIKLEDQPTPRQIRGWYRTFVAGGRDVRALVPCYWARGWHGNHYPQWQIETINRLINDKLVTPTPTSFREVRILANSASKEQAAQRGEEPVLLGRDNAGIGTKLVSRMLRQRDKFGVLLETTNLREAQRRARAIQLGPQGEYVNHAWEVDNTLLDILVIDPETRQIVGRPWLTAILDRYSRCIVGFSMSFAPPSWASVMDALRVAVMPKDWILEGLKKIGNGKNGIENEWNCYGKPDVLVMDHGRDFKSASMDATLAALQIDPGYVKPKKAWLKGKIERWFGTLERQIVHTIPGTVMSNVQDRKFYESEKFAVLTIDELNWVVAKWVIDIYHQNQHSKIGRTPAQAWKEGLQDLPLQRDIPKDLIVPLTGLVIPRSLREGGIRFRGLRWDSAEFSRARAFLPDSANVRVRIDPIDISVAYVYDEKRDKWVEGALVEPVEARGLTLNQWVTISSLRQRIIERDTVSREEALARAFKDIRAFVDERVEGRLKSKAPKKFAAFVSTGSAWATIHPDRDDDDHSPPGGHPLGLGLVDSPPLQEFGPFTEPQRGWREGGMATGAEDQPSERAETTGNAPSGVEKEASPTAGENATARRTTAKSAQPRRDSHAKAKPKLKLNIRPANYGGRGDT